jgi:hypothetical protein
MKYLSKASKKLDSKKIEPTPYRKGRWEKDEINKYNKLTKPRKIYTRHPQQENPTKRSREKDLPYREANPLPTQQERL